MRLLPIFLIALVLLGGCASNVHLKEGRELITAGRSEEGLAHLEQSVRDFPNDREGRAYYFSQRAIAVAEWSAAAEAARRASRFADAEAGWQRVLRAEPGNSRAQAGLAEIVATRRRQGLLAEAENLIKKKDTRAAEMRLRTILAEDSSHAGARALLARLREAGLVRAVRHSGDARWMFYERDEERCEAAATALTELLR